MAENDANRVTRRLALTWAGAAGASLLAACSDGGPQRRASSSASSKAGDDSQLPGPERIKKQTEHLEPTTYVKTYDVNPAGGQGSYKTIQEAYAAVLKDKAEALGIAGMVLAQSNPWDWRLIRVAPGVYKGGAAGIPPHTALVGQGEKPEDVRITFGGNDDTLATTGRSAYIRNLQVEYEGRNPDVHPFRDEGASGDVGLGNCQERTVTLQSVRMKSVVGGSGGQTAADIMTGPGVSLSFIDCVFDAEGQAQAVNLVTDAGPGTRTAQFAFVGCTVRANFSQHPDPARGQSVVTAYVTGFPDFGEGRGDTVLWMDGSWQVGSAAGVGSLLTFPLVKDPSNPDLKAARAGTTYIVVNPGSFPGAPLLVADRTKPSTAAVPTTFDLPMGCLSAKEKTFFGSQPSRTPSRLSPRNAGSGNVAVKAGEVHWVGVDLGSAALRVIGADLGGTPADAVGSVQVRLDHDGRPHKDLNAMTASTSRAAGGDSTVPLQPRWFYPGQGIVWVAIAYARDAKVPAMRAAKGQAFISTGYSPGKDLPDPTAARAVPEGALVPRPILINQWSPAQ